MATRTKAEIDELKEQWSDDPCWDIYETEGFEEHAEELLAYQEMAEMAWQVAEEERLEKRALEIGIAGNISLVKHIEHLERRIDDLNKILERNGL